MSTDLFYDLAQIYQQRALKTLSEDDLAHAKRYRMAGDEIAELNLIIATDTGTESAVATLQGEVENLLALCDQLGEALQNCANNEDDVMLTREALAAWREMKEKS